MSDLDKISEDGGDDDGSRDDGGGTMMSLLASYYGIQESATNNNNNSTTEAERIDTPNFDPSKYFKDLLNSNTIENLVVHDAKMVHDIKSLDSDMQMLVYENYNKFISATETIRRMKDNVEAMEGDMSSVRNTMDIISTNSAILDQSLAAKRLKIDKLVRVKRLLHRLEFLSVLPERLEKMIEQGLYKGAVQLYKKTINVLTNHSHLLSFKKIQERTEKMMQDLRSKVMGMLDDSSLDVVNLTQYASILRLMEASPEKITEKFLTAHKHRSLRMTKQFLADFEASKSTMAASSGKSDNDNGTNVSGASTTGNAEQGGLTVSFVRKFHQNLLVGLIEASKGIFELYHQNNNNSNNHHHGDSGASKPSSSTSKSSDKQSLPATPADSSASATQAYDDLQAMIGIVMTEYTKCMTEILKSFFDRYEQSFASLFFLENNQDNYYDKNSSSNSGNDNDNEGNVRELDAEECQRKQIQIQDGEFDAKKWDLEEEKQSWMLLARQAILDCQYLDSATEACRPGSYDAELPHSDGFAASMLKALDHHCNLAFNRRIRLFKQQILQACPQVRVLCELQKELSAEIENQEAPSARGILQRRISLARAVVENLVEAFFTTFSDICADARPVTEVHTVSRVGSGATDSSSLQLVGRFCDSIAIELEKYIGSSGAVTSRSVNPATGAADIYEESLPVPHPLYKGPRNRDELIFCLLSSRVLARAAPALSSRLEGSLRAHDMKSIGTSSLRDKCIQKIESTAQLLLTTYVENECDRISPLFTNALRQSRLGLRSSYDTNTSMSTSGSPGSEGTGGTGGGGRLSVGESVVGLAKVLDDVARLGISSMERDIARRATAMQSSIGHGHGHGVQFDIERLFSTQIKIFDARAMAPTLESVICCIFKASFKASLEIIRTFSPLTTSMHAQLEVDLAFLKQITSCLLKETAETDGLLEQVMLSVSGRCLRPDESPEVSQLSRAVAEGFYAGSRQCILATGPFQRRAI